MKHRNKEKQGKPRKKQKTVEKKKKVGNREINKENR